MRPLPFLLLCLSLLACGELPPGSSDGGGPDAGTPDAGPTHPDAGSPPGEFRCEADGGASLRVFDFSLGLVGWSGGFADYPVGQEDFYELQWSLEPLPAPLDTARTGFFITGNNHSDDLFMFLKTQLDGLRPSVRYRVAFEVELASSAGSGCAGVGGAPGESVTVKVGATAIEPHAVPVASDYRMNIDKGNQAQGGADAIVIGNVANGSAECSTPPYRLKVLRTGSAGLEATTSPEGSLWLLVGTDSGFEATTALYYTRVRACLTPPP